MRSLIGLEVRRFLARRLFRFLLLVLVGTSVLSGTIVFFNHQAQDPDDLAAGARARTAALQACLDGTDPAPGQHVEVFREDFGYAGPAPDAGPARLGFCEPYIGAVIRDDLRYPATDLTDVLFGTLTPFVLLAMVLGASFIGAEWRANTVGVQLTWEPRRIRLMVTKAIVGAVLGGAFFLAAQAIIVAGLLPTIFLRGDTSGVDAEWLRQALGIAGRGAAFAAIGASLGFSLASIGRNTAAALGVLLGYIALLEGAFIGSLFPDIRPWLLLGNAIVFISGEPDTDIIGRSVLEAGLLLGAYAAALITLAALWFRRRDVAS